MKKFCLASLFILYWLLIIAIQPVYAWDRYIPLSSNSATDAETKPQRTIGKISSKDIDVTYTFSGIYVSDQKIRETECQFLNIDGFSNVNEPGAPALPVHNEIVAVPKGASVFIKILDTETVDLDGFYIAPAREPARDTYGAKEPTYFFDSEIYENDTFFPENVVKITETGISRDTSLAYVQIRPIAFNPVTRKLRAYSRIQFRIVFEGGKDGFLPIAHNNSKHYTDLLKRNVLNSVTIPDGINSLNGMDRDEVVAMESEIGKNYIIITHSAYIDQSNQLADWKRQMGYRVEVVSQSSWTAEEVKTAIHSRYAAWTPKPDYFVIIGDHTGPYAVPGEIHNEPDANEPFATDLYYACMDGTSDYVPDMAHGRIPVSSITEAETVINKIIDYEKTPVEDSSFYDNILNCAQYQDEDDGVSDGYADRRFCHTSEEIRDYLQNNYGYTSQRIYYTDTTFDLTQLRYNNGGFSDGQLLPAALRSTQFNWGGNDSDITAALDEGKLMVFHRDHGYVGGSGWAHPYYTTATMSNMANGNLLPVIFSINCHTGEFQLEACFAEKFLRMANKGAVGVVAAAYYSYSGYNDALAEGMVDAIWSDPGLCPDFGSYGNGNTYTIGAGNDIYTMGDVVNQGLYAMIQNIGDNKYTHELFHYFGDPAMKIWTDDPNNSPISATHAATIDCAGTSFVLSGSTPNAIATLIQDNRLIAKTTLDVSGSGTLNYQITAAGDAVLTVSMHNCKPYVADLTLVGNCAFPPDVRTHPSSDISDISATLNGEIIDDFGQNISESGFVYSSTSNPMLNAQDVMDVQTNPLVQSGPFDIAISGLSPSTSYYVKAYAIGENGIGYGSEVSFTTDCGAFSSFPLTEGFEGGDLPACWLYEGSGWEYASGGHNGYPGTAHTGSYNARFYHGSFTPEVSKLVLPDLSLSNEQSASLTFWHTQANWSGDQDELRIYYRNSPGDAWALLEEYTDDISEWTERTIPLPDLSDDYQIAFEATGQYGYGVCIDDITVTATSITNQPPDQPFGENPTDGETDISINTDLSWSGSDPENDALTYDVYFGTANPPATMVSDDQNDLTFGPGTLQYSTTYRWRVHAMDEHGAETEGNVWSFTTEAEPNHLPAVTTQPPTDITTTTATGNATIIDPGLPLATAHGVCWNSTGSPNIDNDDHTDEGALHITATYPMAFTSAMSGLLPDTEYYVRAYATNTQGTAYGDTLTFTTERSPAGFYVGDISGNTGEDGTAATFTVSLTAAPHADVTLPVSSSDTGEGTVNPNSLTFTANDWNVDQTVTVTGVDDTLEDGNQTYEVRFGAVVSADTAYNGLTPDPVSVINVDDDSGAGSDIYLPFLNILLDE